VGKGGKTDEGVALTLDDQPDLIQQVRRDNKKRRGDLRKDSSGGRGRTPRKDTKRALQHIETREAILWARSGDPKVFRTVAGVKSPDRG